MLQSRGWFHLPQPQFAKVVEVLVILMSTFGLWCKTLLISFPPRDLVKMPPFPFSTCVLLPLWWWGQPNTTQHGISAQLKLAFGNRFSNATSCHSGINTLKLNPDKMIPSNTWLRNKCNEVRLFALKMLLPCLALFKTYEFTYVVVLQLEWSHTPG